MKKLNFLILPVKPTFKHLRKQRQKIHKRCTYNILNLTYRNSSLKNDTEKILPGKNPKKFQKFPKICVIENLITKNKNHKFYCHIYSPQKVGFLWSTHIKIDLFKKLLRKQEN